MRALTFPPLRGDPVPTSSDETGQCHPSLGCLDWTLTRGPVGRKPGPKGAQGSGLQLQGALAGSSSQQPVRRA